MSTKKFVFHLLVLGYTSSSAAVFAETLPTSTVFEQSNDLLNQYQDMYRTSIDTNHFAFFQPPSFPSSRGGTPRGRRRGAGTYSECQIDTSLPPLYAISPTYPVDDSDTEIPWVQALIEKPTLWFYVPYTAQSSGSEEISIGELRLLSLEGDILYTWTIELPEKPGVLGLQIQTVPASNINTSESEVVKVEEPSRIAFLQLPENVDIQWQVEKTFAWNFAIICSPEEISENDFVEGEISLVAKPEGLETAFQSKPPYQAYAEYGLWSDTLTSLYEEILLNPALGTHWTELLQSIDLEEIASEDIIVTPNESDSNLPSDNSNN